MVVAVGGGSVIDAGKAISAMFSKTESVIAYVEGVGEGKVHDGTKILLLLCQQRQAQEAKRLKMPYLDELAATDSKIH